MLSPSGTLTSGSSCARKIDFPRNALSNSQALDHLTLKNSINCHAFPAFKSCLPSPNNNRGTGSKQHASNLSDYPMLVWLLLTRFSDGITKLLPNFLEPCLASCSCFQLSLFQWIRSRGLDTKKFCFHR